MFFYRVKGGRRKLSVTFTHTKLKETHDLINEYSEQLMIHINEKLKQNNYIEMKQIAGKFSTDVIGTCIFGLKFDAIKNNNSEFLVHAKKLLQPSIRQFFVKLLAMFFPKLVKILKLQVYLRETLNLHFYQKWNLIKFKTNCELSSNRLTHLLIYYYKHTCSKCVI